MKNENQNNIDYLNKKTNRDVGFSVPQNYFENLEDAVLVKLAEDHFVKTKGFEVPDSYFDTLEDTILAKVSTSKKEIKIISFKKQILKLIPIAVAASVILFISLNSFIFNKNEDPFEKLDDNDIENWISNNIDLINDTDIAYADINFDETEMIPNSISNDDLENYLSNQDNISLILEND
ncbi:MAG: hypothetical protein ACPGTO_00570 [Polaribacter sp.]